MMREAEERANYWGYPAHHVVRDLVYADYNGRRLKLDLYRPPPGAAAPAPGIVVVRGGAFRVGDKIFFGYIAGQLAEAGFVTASIEYRTSNEARFPAAVQDVKAAARWMRAHAATYGVNPNAIGAIGGSAGAHLVVMLATSHGVPELEGTGGNPDVPSDVQAVVAMGGGFDLLWKKVGPREQRFRTSPAATIAFLRGGRATLSMTTAPEQTVRYEAAIELGFRAALFVDRPFS